MENKHQFSLWYFVFVFILISYLQSFFNAPRVENLPYSDFKTLLKAKKLDKIQLTETDISGTILLKGIEDFLPFERAEALKKYGATEHSFYTVRLEDPELIDDLELSGVSFAGKKENRWIGNVISWVIPILLFLAIWSYLFRRMGSMTGGMMEI
ncbi:MAG: ATP-dependent metallopeptidase FtsH/Yme1/Tma family protein, partial [Gammaproteobacteria bacterium]